MASTWLSEPGTLCSSKPVLLLFVTALLRGPLCSDCSPILSTHQRHRTDPGLGDGHGGVVEVSELEEDGAVNMQILESLKEQFLRTFNLSGSGPQLSAASTREEPPEYMMELYNRFANDRNALPSANIIRSFQNEDPSPSVIDAGGARRHKLLFNVSVPHHERVTAAELRLYTLVQTDRHLYAGVDRKVTIYELETIEEATNTTEEEYEDGEERVRRDTEQIHLTELASRQVFGTDNGWEAFDLTNAVQRWRKSEHGTTHQLEVQIASVESEEKVHKRVNESDNSILQDMKIDTSPEEKHKPLLIVFSDDQSSDHREDKRELNEMIDHETSNMVPQNEIWNDLEKSKDLYEDEAEPDEEDLIQMRSNFIYDTASRIRRNAKGNHCKKQSLYVEFKDIGWDSWILAPAGYDAYECTGVCSFPLTKHVTPTKHAIVQTLVNINSPQKASRACCVPTKLDPISLLYLDDTGVVTYKYKYDGMVVAECGCR
uniref:Bone morphogenetic protein 10 n=1 Tax=Neogobius melanostomus TaxID=47308 RepID=A0A8C6U2E8_9GOBI